MHCLHLHRLHWLHLYRLHWLHLYWLQLYGLHELYGLHFFREYLVVHELRVVLPDLFLALAECAHFLRAVPARLVLGLAGGCLPARFLPALLLAGPAGLVLGGDFGVACVLLGLPSLNLPTSSLKRSSTTLRSSCASLRLDSLRSMAGVKRRKSDSPLPLRIMLRVSCLASAFSPTSIIYYNSFKPPRPPALANTH